MSGGCVGSFANGILLECIPLSEFGTGSLPQSCFGSVDASRIHSLDVSTRLRFFASTLARVVRRAAVATCRPLVPAALPHTWRSGASGQAATGLPQAVLVVRGLSAPTAQHVQEVDLATSEG